MKSDLSESALLSFCLSRLWHEREWLYSDRINCGSVTVKNKDGSRRMFRGAKNGTSDISCFFSPHGRKLAIECKVGNNKLSEDQLKYKDEVESKGGLFYEVRTPERLEEIIKELKP